MIAGGMSLEISGLFQIEPNGTIFSRDRKKVVTDSRQLTGGTCIRNRPPGNSPRHGKHGNNSSLSNGTPIPRDDWMKDQVSRLPPRLKDMTAYLAMDHRIPFRHGSESLPLKKKDWNGISIALHLRSSRKQHKLYT